MSNPDRSAELSNVLDDLISGAVYEIGENGLRLEGDCDSYSLPELFSALLERAIELQDSVDELDLLDE